MGFFKWGHVFKGNGMVKRWVTNFTTNFCAFFSVPLHRGIGWEEKLEWHIQDVALLKCCTLGEMLGIRAAKDPSGFIGIADALDRAFQPGF